MSAPTALVHNKPIITLHTLKIPNSPTSRLHLSGKFLFPRLVSKQNRIWGSNTMNEISAFRGSFDNDVEGEIGGVDRGALEQESLIHGSNLNRMVPPFFASTSFESTLNSMKRLAGHLQTSLYGEHLFIVGSSYLASFLLFDAIDAHWPKSKWLMTALFLTVGVIRHDAIVLWAAMGSVTNVLLSNVLKKIINQERPVSALKSDPGMPSSHAQSIFFIFIFAIISMIESFGANGLTIALSGLTLAIGSYLSWLRVSQKLHTIKQVLVGAAVGSIFSILWFWSWDTFVEELFFSSLWVRIIVGLGAAGFSLGFTIYAIQNWIKAR